MARRNMMCMGKSKLLTCNMKDITCSNLTGPWLYENYLSSTSTPVVNATKATISATNALSKFPRNNRMLSPKAKLLKQNMKGLFEMQQIGVSASAVNKGMSYYPESAVPRKKGRYVGLARSIGGASFSSTGHGYPPVEDLMQQIKNKDMEIEFLKNDNAEIRVELNQNKTALEDNMALTKSLLEKFKTRFGEDF
ncbi:hypothetical protein Bca4012_020049 [Brassica carinata]